MTPEWANNEPLWSAKDSGNSVDIVPMDADHTWTDEGDEPEFLVRVTLTHDVDLKLESSGAATQVEAFTEFDLAYQDLEDLYLALQRFFGHAEDERILARRESKARREQAHEQQQRHSALWQRWINEHPWVVAKKNERRSNGGRYASDGVIHAKDCRYAPAPAIGTYDGWMTATEVAAFEQGQPIRDDKTLHPDNWRSIRRCKVCCDPLDREIKELEHTPQDTHADLAPVVDLDQPDEDNVFRLADPIVITAGEHEGHAGQFVAYRGNADGEPQALVALYYLTAASEGPVLVPLKYVKDPDIPETP